MHKRKVMLNKIRQILIKIDPTVRALKPEVSDNLLQPIEKNLRHDDKIGKS